MSKPSVANPQDQQLHDNVQEAVKSILGATQASAQTNYSKVLTSTLAATEKSVKIQIASSDLTQLKQNGYSLCFAKKVGNDSYNVIWQSYTGFLSNNTFKWSPQYQVFGSNLFQAGQEVDISTNLITIGTGQQAIIDQSGVIGPASTGGPENTITLVNQYGSIYPGLTQLSTGIDGRMISTAVFLSPTQAIQGVTQMTPTDVLLVWFQQNVQTGTLFSGSRSNAVEIDLNNDSTATRLYTGSKWQTP
jgi:hypothetical protein